MADNKNEKKELKQKVDQTQINLEEERRLLEWLAEECMRAGKNFSEDPILMEQSEKVDQTIVSLHDLQDMLEEAED